MNLVDLPSDIIFTLCLRLDYRDICSLRDTHPRLLRRMSDDKHLWSHVFRRDVKELSFIVPSNLRSIDEVDAKDIQSWLKHTHLLNQGYRTPNRPLTVRRIDLRPGLRATWVKLIHARWCLIASADDDESELSLWEIMPCLDIRMVARMYLDAPVMDGEVDCCENGTRCAITVGAKQPYVLVLGLSRLSGHASFTELALVPSVSCVTFFQGDFLGVSTSGGDDTYPHLINWKTAEAFCMSFPHNNPQINCPFPMEPCKAMAAKDGFIFTAHVTMLQVFSFPGTIHGGGARLLSAFPLGRVIVHGSFVGSASSYLDNPSLKFAFVYQDSESVVRRVAIEIDRDHRSTSMFSIQEAIVRQSPYGEVLHYWKLGSTGRVIIGFISSIDFSRKLIAVFASIKAPEKDDAAHPPELDGGSVAIPDETFSVTQLISCVDFDDGHGLLLSGSALGELSLASILEKSVMTPNGVRDTSGDGSYSSHKREKLYEMPISLDLPLFYHVRKNHSVEDQLPREIVLQYDAEWRDPRLDSRLGNMEDGRWSNDWSRFKSIWRWILPVSRWGPLDRDFMLVTERYRLHTVGEIIPVLYCTRNHDEVVFRVGQRLYYSNWEPKDEYGRVIDLTIDDYGLLGVLPLSYDEFVGDPQEILPFLRDGEVQTNLSSWELTRDVTNRIEHAYRFYEPPTYPERENREPVTFSNEDWPPYVNGDKWDWT